MHPLRFASGHTALLDDLFRAIVEAIGRSLHYPVTVRHDLDWQERYRQLDAGGLDVAWICGAPYVQRVATDPAALRLLAAPVWRGARYGHQPVYFADVIVRSDQPWHTFADLQGATWVYNEPGSLSGFDAMRYYLAQQGHDFTFFGQRQASGGHLRSVQLILDGVADLTAIDSVVLETHLRQHPDQAALLRTIATIGPLPSMPWVASRTLDPALSAALRTHLTHLHETHPPLLVDSPLHRFAPMEDAAYDPIRAMINLTH
jgi:phosphonate transport system substrate-binding protein